MSRARLVLGALAVTSLAVGALACKTPPPPEPALIERDYLSTDDLEIATAPNAGIDGPAVVLTDAGELHRVGAKVERIAKGVRCVGRAGNAAKAVTDTQVITVELDKKSEVAVAFDELTQCSVAYDGAIVALTRAGVVRVDADGAKTLTALPPPLKAPVAIASDRTGAVWVLDKANIYAWKDGAWKSTFSQNVNGSSSELRELDLLADGSLVVSNEFHDYAQILGGKSRSVTLYGGLKSLIPNAIGSGADGVVWGGNYKWVVRARGKDSKSWEHADIGLHGGVPTAMTGDGRGRGWIANEVALAVVSDAKRLLGEIGSDAFADQKIVRIVVVGAGPPEIRGGALRTWTGEVSGTVRVRDEVVPGAVVTLCSEGLDLKTPCENAKVKFEAIADGEGKFTMPAVPPLDLRAVVVAGTQQFVPMSAHCCGLMTRGKVYKLDFDLGDSMGVDGKPSCPKELGARKAPCKIPGVPSRPLKTVL